MARTWAPQQAGGDGRDRGGGGGEARRGRMGLGARPGLSGRPTESARGEVAQEEARKRASQPRQASNSCALAHPTARTCLTAAGGGSLGVLRGRCTARRGAAAMCRRTGHSSAGAGSEQGASRDRRPLLEPNSARHGPHRRWCLIWCRLAVELPVGELGGRSSTSGHGVSCGLPQLTTARLPLPRRVRRRAPGHARARSPPAALAAAAVPGAAGTSRYRSGCP